jgi:glycosyltransferase involved in cell wall biosynthesis
MEHKILIISCVFRPEPVVSAGLSFDLATFLADNAGVTVLSPKPTRPSGYKFSRSEVYESASFRHIVTDSYTSPASKIIGRLRESISFGIECKKHILTAREQYDCIYMNNWPIFAQYFVAKAASKKKVRLVTHIQDIYPEAFVQKAPKLFRGFLFKVLYPLELFTLNKSDKVITISNGMKQFLCQTRSLAQNKVDVVHNWQDEAPFELAEEAPKEEGLDKLTFLFLGTIGPLTNLDFVIRCFSTMDSKEARLIIAGQGSEKRKLEKLAAKFENVDIAFIEAEAKNVPLIQNSADVLLLSLIPGAGKLALPSKLIAYMLSAKPVLAVVDRDSDVSKVIRTSKSGWVSSPSDSVELKEVFSEIIITSNAVLKSKGMMARNYALENYTRKVNLDKIKRIILDHG